MSSTELFDAASISITSSELARAIDRHESHSPHGSVVGPRSQFKHAARIFAIEVLPVPREPTNRYAWCTLSRSTAFRSVRTTGSWPTTSANVRGRCLRYSDRCCCCDWSSTDTVRLSLPTPVGGLDHPLQRVASALMAATIKRWAQRAGAPLWIIGGAVLLRVLSGVGFANYDTLYALAWGGQLSRGQAPAYSVPVAPTPHPLLEALGAVLSPLGPRAAENVTVALGFLALSGCGWVIYRLGEEWFSRAAGALAALVFLTRVPVLSYGVRAYVDLPYLLLVLGALLVESRSRSRAQRPAGAPVLALLALAGLLRPEAWAFSGLYWLYALEWTPALLRGRGTRAAGALRSQRPTRTRREIAQLTLLAAAALLLWVLSDLAITGQPLWSLSNTRHTASTLGRVTGIANVPQYIPRRIGEILRPPG